MQPAPIVVFCYNRPWHLSRTLNALKNNLLAKESTLHLFCDGLKPGAAENDRKAIAEVAKICSETSGFAAVIVHKSDENKGLQNSVISGLNHILSEHESVVVVEDDVVTSPYFLTFMNEALRHYKNNERVISIGSWNYFYEGNGNFFSPMPDTIAWATWADRWAKLETDGTLLLKELEEKRLMKKFNLDGNFDFEKMLRMQIEGQVSSWAIRWTAVAVLGGKLSLYPAQALSKHIGFGADATNCEGDDYNRNLVLASHNLDVETDRTEENKDAINSWLRIEGEVKNSGLYTGSEYKRQDGSGTGGSLINRLFSRLRK